MRVLPSEDAFVDHAGDEDAALLSVTLLADTETPVSAYARLGGGAAGAGPSLLLESVEGGERMARMSFFAARVRRTLRLEGDVLTSRDGARVEARRLSGGPGDDPLDALRAALPRLRLWSPRPPPPLCAGAIGLFAFDLVSAFEGVPLPPLTADSPAPPEIGLLLPSVLGAYDHAHRTISLLATASLSGDAAQRRRAHRVAAAELESALHQLQTGPRLPPWQLTTADPAPPPWREATPRASFEASVAAAKEAIAAGEVFQVVLSRRFRVDASLQPLALYRALRAINPSPYMFLLDLGDVALVGASPEVLVRVEGEQILLRPIAGTRRRGRDTAEDAALAAELLADDKELAEHRMLVDLGRNDVGRVARTGSVLVEDPLHIERYSHVQHIVTDVRGQLRPDRDALDALRAAFPAGTVSGAPKVRALELLAALEPQRRGAYAGAVGYLDVRGNLDTAIAIRTLIVHADHVLVQAGAGVVADSTPAAEADECEAKARAALVAVAMATQQHNLSDINTSG